MGCEFLVKKRFHDRGPAQMKAHRFCHGPVGAFDGERKFHLEEANFYTIITTLVNLLDFCEKYCKYNVYAQDKNILIHSDTSKGFVAKSKTVEQLKDRHKEIKEYYENEQ